MRLGIAFKTTVLSSLSSQRMVVLELMAHGDLRDFLIKRRPVYA